MDVSVVPSAAVMLMAAINGHVANVSAIRQMNPSAMALQESSSLIAITPPSHAPVPRPRPGNGRPVSPYADRWQRRRLRSTA